MRCAPSPEYRPRPTPIRSFFNFDGCHIHGHPSTGGILIKHSADLVDLHYLSLPRLTSTPRSSDAAEEDAFCERLRRVGASWWKDEDEFLRAYHGIDEYIADTGSDIDWDLQDANAKRAKRRRTFGWPADGLGVWVTKLKPFLLRPEGYGTKMCFALSMEERIGVMQEFGAEFVEDVEMVKELNEPWSEDVYGYYTEEEEDDTSSSSAAVSLSEF